MIYLRKVPDHGYCDYIVWLDFYLLWPGCHSVSCSRLKSVTSGRFTRSPLESVKNFTYIQRLFCFVVNITLIEWGAVPCNWRYSDTTQSGSYYLLLYSYRYPQAHTNAHVPMGNNLQQLCIRVHFFRMKVNRTFFETVIGKIRSGRTIFTFPPV